MAHTPLLGVRAPSLAKGCRMTQDWHASDVAAALKKCGYSLSGLSISNGYHQTAAGKALKQHWPAMERIIAHAVGVTPEEIWPSRYSDGGRPVVVHRKQTAQWFER